MAMATKVVASAARLGVTTEGAHNLYSRRRGCATQFQPRSCLPCSISVPAVSPRARWLQTRRRSTVLHALQTDTLTEETGYTKAIEKLKELVGLEGGNSEVADEQELLRFLRSKSFDTETAAKAFTQHQKWRTEFVPKGYFTEDEVISELESMKSYWIYEDKKGRPALLTLGRNHTYNRKDFDEFKRFIVYAFDRLIREATPDEENFVCIVDLQGLGLKNLDSKSFIAAFDIMEKHYPGRLDKVFMINVPFIFNGLWKVVKPFIDEETRNRIQFVEKNQLHDTLSNEIDSEFLPKEYGGTADLVPLQTARTPNWPPSL